MTGYDLISIGTATLDIILHTPLPPSGGRIILPLGAKLESEASRFSLGGGAVTVTRVALRHGLRAAYHGTLGTGMLDDALKHYLREEQIPFTGTRQEGEGAFSIILLSQTDRSIITHKGVSRNPLRSTPPRATAYYYTSPHPDVLSLYEKHMHAQREAGSMVIFNPSLYLIHGHQKEILRMLRWVSLLILNREEALLLTGEKQMHAAAERLIRQASMVVITNGPGKGMARTTYGCWEYQPFTPHTLRDTTGAGDIFGGSLASALLTGMSFPRAVRYAATHASLSIQHEGVSKSILRPATISRHVKRVTLIPCPNETGR